MGEKYICFRFQNNYRVPGIIGAIDCTQVRIITPVKDEFVSVN